MTCRLGKVDGLTIAVRKHISGQVVGQDNLRLPNHAILLCGTTGLKKRHIPQCGAVWKLTALLTGSREPAAQLSAPTRRTKRAQQPHNKLSVSQRRPVRQGGEAPARTGWPERQAGDLPCPGHAPGSSGAPPCGSHTGNARTGEFSQRRRCATNTSPPQFPLLPACGTPNDSGEATLLDSGCVR
jgi:hypothetical protein